MQWVSLWTNGIIIAIVIVTLVEMLLPNGNNKKYIKTILGLYVLFTIIGPVIEKIGNGKWSFEDTLKKWEDTQEYQTFSVNSIETSSNIEAIYKQKLEEDIITKLKAKGYDITITALSIQSVQAENYGENQAISIKIKKKIKKEINSIEPVEIAIGNEEKKENIELKDKETIKKYIAEEYKMQENRINVF